MDRNMVGAYGAWIAELVAANDPGLLSYRRPEFSDVEAWRAQARAKMLECLALPDSGGTPQVEVVERNLVDGLEAEILRWQLPYGPPTDAVFLKPAGATGPLPGILALHDHGGMKYFGYRKIADDGRPLHPLLRRHRDEDYAGTAWANEIAKRGYAVLCHDTAPFGSRRVRVADTPPALHRGAKDVSPEEPAEEIHAYNQWAGQHEDIWAKSLMSAGTFWPSLFLSDDMRALDVLCARPEVDATRIGCAGLSGGGCRTVYLAGVDERIQTGICAGMMTTWRDIALYKNWTHTWMMWTPMLAQYLDYAEILALQLPKPMLVLSNNEDPLFTLSEMHRADEMLRAIYDKAGVSERYAGKFYPGPHKLDLEMQADAWEWFDRWLKG